MTGPELILQYILAKKGVDIGGVAEPRNEHEWNLYRQAYIIAAMWKATQAYDMADQNDNDTHEETRDQAGA